MCTNNRIFILIAGANASGKSSIIKPKYVEGRVKRYIDPDRLLPIAKEDILSDRAREVYKSESPDRFAVECMKDWLASERICNEGIATESNLVTKKHDFECFELAKKTGMHTELYFVYVPLETAIQREQIRANNKGQEKIPEQAIRIRHPKGLANIQKHIDSGNIDVIKIYDNSRGIGEEQLLLHIEDGMTVYLHLDPPQWFRDALIKKALNTI